MEYFLHQVIAELSYKQNGWPSEQKEPRQDLYH